MVGAINVPHSIFFFSFPLVVVRVAKTTVLSSSEATGPFVLENIIRNQSYCHKNPSEASHGSSSLAAM